MSRLIDADKLDEEVMHLFITITGNPKQSIVVDECKKSFRNMIDEQPTAELPETAKWIPCSERLPEMHREDMEAEGEYYMISNPVLVADGNKMYVAEYEEDDGYRCGWHSLDGEDYEGIIAWMPLPESYRPDKCHGCFGAANNDCERCMDGNG